MEALILVDRPAKVLVKTEKRGNSQMKRCKRCDRPFIDDDNYAPVRELGEIFPEEVGDIDVEDLCLKCTEDLGIMNLLGFGQ